MGPDRLRPDEFWRLHPRELWWIIKSLQPAKMYGSMSEAEVRQIYEETYGGR